MLVFVKFEKNGLHNPFFLQVCEAHTVIKIRFSTFKLALFLSCIYVVVVLILIHILPSQQQQLSNCEQNLFVNYKLGLDRSRGGNCSLRHGLFRSLIVSLMIITTCK